MSQRRLARFASAALVCLALGLVHTAAEAQEAATRPAAGKLVITKAVYGDLPDGAKTDVTDKVKEKVKDDALSVDANNDAFGDPAEGVLKKLKVEYTFDGKAAEKTVDEGQTLTISNTGE